MYSRSVPVVRVANKNKMKQVQLRCPPRKFGNEEITDFLLSRNPPDSERFVQEMNAHKPKRSIYTLPTYYHVHRYVLHLKD